jgi:hypothetical protein
MKDFLESANILLESLTEYEQVTDKFALIEFEEVAEVAEDGGEVVAVGSEESEVAEDSGAAEDILTFAIDDIEDILHEREELREPLEFARDEMMKLTEKLPESDLLNVKEAFAGKSDLGGGIEVIREILAVQKRIAEKDAAFSTRFQAKQVQVKSELKNLQSSKKKIGFLQMNAGAQEGTSFNI